MVMQSISEADLNNAARFLRFKSLLRRADLMSPTRVDGIVNHTIRMVYLLRG